MSFYRQDSNSNHELSSCRCLHWVFKSMGPLKLMDGEGAQGTLPHTAELYSI